MVLLLVSCMSAEVPPHAESVGSLLDAGLQLDWDRTQSVAVELARPVEGLDATDRHRWEPLRTAATALSKARKKSEFSVEYGVLMASCQACHSGGELPPPRALKGHGAGVMAVERSVVVADRGIGLEGVKLLIRSPDLGPSHRRIIDLAGRIADSTSPALDGKLYGRMVLECYQCHGSLTP